MNKPEAEDEPRTGIIIHCDAVGDSHRLSVYLQFHDEGADDLNTAWIRSLFICCISSENQQVSTQNIFKSRVVLPGDLKQVHYKTPLITAKLKLDLAKDLDRKLAADSYYVTVSARQYISNTVLIEVE